MIKFVTFFVFLSTAVLLGAEPPKDPIEQELLLRFALTQEMIARRQLEIRELAREMGEIKQQLEKIKEKNNKSVE